MHPILNVGSLNLDYVYAVPHLVRAGETLSATDYACHAGGKGLNQSLALARSGARVMHVGAVGEDGAALTTILRESGVDVSRIATVSGPSGHALIQKEPKGENAILLHGGANRRLAWEQIEAAIDQAPPGSWLLAQNETNLVFETLQAARAKGLRVAWNPAPMSADPSQLPLGCVNCLILNEVEAAQLIGRSEPNEMRRELRNWLPTAVIVLTLGSKGVFAIHGEQTFEMPAISVPEVVDTTAAGDTFTGYFLSAWARGVDLETAMDQATRAAALCIQRSGAAPSIPWAEELSSLVP